MSRNHSKVSAGGSIIFLLVLANAVILRAGFTGDGSWYPAMLITLPLLLIVIFNSKEKKQNPYERKSHFIKRRRQGADLLH